MPKQPYLKTNVPVETKAKFAAKAIELGYTEARACQRNLLSKPVGRGLAMSLACDFHLQVS